MSSSASPSAWVRLDAVDVEIDGTTVLHEVSWRLLSGEHWGLVGANGSGKSTLLALIAGIRWPAPDRGRRVYDFGRGVERDCVEARREIALVGHEAQDRYTRYAWNFTARDVVLSGLFRTDVPRHAASPHDATRALERLEEARLAELAERPFLELSRGEQRRVLIARALAFEPSVLLLDEPLSGLDKRARAAVNGLLERIAARIPLVVAAHARADLPSVVTHIAEIDGGRIAASGPPARPAPQPARAAGPARRAMTARGRQGRRAAPRHAGPTTRRAAPRHRDGEPLIDVRGAEVWLADRCVLHGIDWRLREGEHWLVSGANGAGKSTFLRLLHGQLRSARGGGIRFPALGDPRDVWTLRRRVAWLSPELQAGYSYRATVAECVASGFDSSLGLVRRPSADERARVDALLEQLELGELAERPLTALSYGQQRRVLLARALVHRPRVLLLDEPWEGLDRDAGALLSARLDECVREGTHLICASHLDVDHARYTHALVLERGTIAAAGPRERVLGETLATA